MLRTNLKKYRKFRDETRNLLWKNPVLAEGLALPFAIAATTSLINGIVLSLAMLGAVMVPAIAYHVYGTSVSGWLKPVLYSTINIFVVLIAVLLLSGTPAIIDSLGIYLPMVALNTITMRMVSDDYNESGNPVHNAFFSWVGFSAVILVLSAIRELIGLGTLFGQPVSIGLPVLSPVAFTFSGFILVGFLAAAVRCADRAFISNMRRKDNRYLKGEMYE